jgi:hypothetical protein
MKKYKYILIGLLMLVNLALSAQPYITKFDVSNMADKLLPDFELKVSSVHWAYGRRYIFENNNKDYLYFTIGLYSSKEKAHSIVQDYFSDISMKFIEDTLIVNQIGDKLWYNTGIEGIVSSVIFLRNNALFFLSSHQFNGTLLSFAKSIDNSLMDNAPFVVIGNKIDVPVVRPMVSLEEGGKKGTINFTAKFATDSLEYSFLPGITKRNGQYIINNVEKFKKNMGKQETIKVVGVNRYNVVSEITEFKLNE